MGKFAMAGLTCAWAHDLAPRGMTVNCIQLERELTTLKAWL
jgi:NAD(P)-dependent dehydrogenase (short-subunit alcohol dehydrogenase family)